MSYRCYDFCETHVLIKLEELILDFILAYFQLFSEITITMSTSQEGFHFIVLIIISRVSMYLNT